MQLVSMVQLDEYCELDGIVFSNNNISYSCLLNQTDIKTNKNKYYIMQIIVANNDYYVYVRYGRVSEKGKIIIKKFNNESDAILKFLDQFKLKTGKIFS